MVSEQIRGFGKFCSQRQYVGRVIHSEFLMILSKLKAAETQGKRYMVHLHTHMHTHNPSAALSPSDDATVVRSREMYLHRSPALGPLLRASFRCAEPEASPTNHGDCTTVPLCCARPLLLMPCQARRVVFESQNPSLQCTWRCTATKHLLGYCVISVGISKF